MQAGQNALHERAKEDMSQLSSFHTLMDLSQHPVSSLVPVRSNVEAMMPDSASRDPGCGISSRVWNGMPEV